MKSLLVLLLVLILCYLCSAQTPNINNDISVQAVESREEKARMLRPTAEAEGGQQAQELQSDVWAELRYLRDMVVEQKVELRHLTTRVTAAESLVEELLTENTAMAARVTAAESRVEELMTENTAMEARMTTAESLVEELQRENNAQATELAVIQQRLTISENQVEELEKQQEGQRAAVQELQNTNTVEKVAFSASLLTSGEGNTDHGYDLRHLIFRNVITNTGNHYNPNTGYFSAPVRGVYYFRFTGHVAHSELSMRLDLIKNGNHVVTAGDRHTTSEDVEDNASNGSVLQLEARDVVSVQHFGNVWDDQCHRTTFSGFLLFPL